MQKGGSMKRDKMSWFGLGVCVGVMITSLIITLTGCGNRPEEKKTEEPLVKGIETEEILVEEVLIEEIKTEEIEVEEKKVVRWYMATRFEDDNGESYYQDILLDGEPIEAEYPDEYSYVVTFKDGHIVTYSFEDKVGGTKVYCTEGAE